jgi:hypothetical protein
MRARQLLVEAEAHWNEDNFEPAIATYETALALVNCSSDVCVSLEEHEHLQAHANLGSAHMSRAHAGAQPEALGTELEEMIASERHWVIPHAARPSATSAFFLKLLRADIQMAHAALRHDAGGKASSATPAAPPALRVEPVQRRAAANISVAEFLAEYATPRVPVVLTGLALPTAEAFARSLGPFAGARVPLRQHDATLRQWAALSGQVASVSLLDAVEAIDRVGNSGAVPAVFDWGLPPGFQFSTPVYFRGDLLAKHRWRLAANNGAANASDAAAPAALIDRWPSLFAQPAGARCGLHVDAHGTHFWQAVVRGRKQWRIFPQSETARLYPHPPNRAWFGVPDAFAPDFATFPALAGARVLETELGEGELIFVPADSPHQVPERACERERKFLVRITHTASQRPRNPQQPP